MNTKYYTWHDNTQFLAEKLRENTDYIEKTNVTLQQAADALDQFRSLLPPEKQLFQKLLDAYTLAANVNRKLAECVANLQPDPTL